MGFTRPFFTRIGQRCSARITIAALNAGAAGMEGAFPRPADLRICQADPGGKRRACGLAAILAMAIGTCLVLGLGTNVLLTNQQKMVDRTDRRDLSLFQIGYRYLIRLLVSGRVKNFKMKFSWEFKLPPAGYKKKKKRHKTT